MVVTPNSVVLLSKKGKKKLVETYCNCNIGCTYCMTELKEPYCFLLYQKDYLECHNYALYQSI